MRPRVKYEMKALWGEGAAEGDSTEQPVTSEKALRWESFVEQNDRVLRGYPAAVPAGSQLDRCPRHDVLIGPVTQMCLACHREAWAELGRLYRGGQADNGRARSPFEGEARPR